MKLKNTVTDEFSNGLGIRVGVWHDDKGNIQLHFGEYENGKPGKRFCMAVVNDKEKSKNKHENLYNKLYEILESYGKIEGGKTKCLK